MLRTLKSLFIEPKAKFCYSCGEQLITHKKNGAGKYSNEDWLMLSCPQLLEYPVDPWEPHYSTILKAGPRQPEYDIYTGRRLDVNTDSFHR